MASKGAKIAVVQSRVAFAMAIITCMAGLFFCVVKSPHARAVLHQANVTAALETGLVQEAGTAAYESVRLDPSSAAGWSVLAAVLENNGARDGAARAERIASLLSGKTVSTMTVAAYAAPADLRLSLLQSFPGGGIQ